MLSARGAGGARPPTDPLERVRFPDRAQVPRVPGRLPAARAAHRLHRARDGRIQDEQAHRARGRLAGVVAALRRHAGPPLMAERPDERIDAAYYDRSEYFDAG